MKITYPRIFLYAFHLLIWLVPVVIFELSPVPITIGVLVSSDFNFFYPLYYGLLFNLLFFYGGNWFLLPRIHKRYGWYGVLAGSFFLFLVVSFLESLPDFYVVTINDFYEREINFWEIFVTNLLLNIVILLLLLGYFFIEQFVLAEQNKAKLREEKLQMELDFLKWQVNPHFIFNTLNNLFGKARKNNDNETATYIEKLSGLMRYMIYETNTDFTKIKNEVDYLNNYLGLQKMRFSENDKVDIRFFSDTNVIKKTIAPAIFIPFIENAFKYGISLKKPSFIHISLELIDNQIAFSVKNSKHNHIQKSDNSGIGLKNVKRRLEILYPGRHELTVSEMPDAYTIHLLISCAP